ncbi:DUF2171 domain-containing protein [Tautonia plasticadhaerens]|uniref:DUF2171 domain-containing protein n=1 Tax=Tautonia plasticadhaerens TaxID=2527974 RepID=UPI0011A57C94
MAWDLPCLSPAPRLRPHPPEASPTLGSIRPQEPPRRPRRVSAAGWDWRLARPCLLTPGTRAGKSPVPPRNGLLQVPPADGQHHRIPMAWVAKVHDHIDLDRDHNEVHAQWQPA